MTRAVFELSAEPTAEEIRAKIAEIDRALRKMRWRKQAGDEALADRFERWRAQLALALKEMG